MIEANDVYNKIIPDEKYSDISERTLVHTGVGAYKYNSIDDQELFAQYRRYKALKLTSVFDLTGGLLTTHQRKVSAEKDPIWKNRQGYAKVLCGTDVGELLTEEENSKRANYRPEKWRVVKYDTNEFARDCKINAMKLMKATPDGEEFVGDRQNVSSEEVEGRPATHFRETDEEKLLPTLNQATGIITTRSIDSLNTWSKLDNCPHALEQLINSRLGAFGNRIISRIIPAEVIKTLMKGTIARD